MKRSMVPAVLAAAFVVSSCHDGASEDVAETHVEVELSPSTAYAGDPVSIGVTAQNPDLAILDVRVDFTGDGVWDEAKSFHAHAVTTTFTHVYANPGSYEVAAEVVDANGGSAMQTETVTVTDPPVTVPVTYVLDGVSPEGGSCFAVDRPATCADCWMLVGTSTPLGVTGSLGAARHGARITFDQGFGQWPVVYGRQLYRCDFYIHLFAGRPGHELPFAHGTCQTSSESTPAQLACRITASGLVP